MTPMNIFQFNFSQGVSEFRSHSIKQLCHKTKNPSLLFNDPYSKTLSPVIILTKQSVYLYITLILQYRVSRSDPEETTEDNKYHA